MRCALQYMYILLGFFLFVCLPWYIIISLQIISQIQFWTWQKWSCCSKGSLTSKLSNPEIYAAVMCFHIVFFYIIYAPSWFVFYYYIIIIIIVVMKQACLKCIDCCFEIGDKVFYVCARTFFFIYMICQTLDWSEFSNISKLRDVFDKHNCTDSPPPA